MKRLMTIIFAGMLLLSACSAGDADVTAESATDGFAVLSDAPAAAAYGDEVVPSIEPEAYSPLDGLYVIREASMELRVEQGSFERAWAAILAVVETEGGYMADAARWTEVQGEELFAFGRVTLRIPADRFEGALARLGDQGEQIGFSMSSDDVTGTVVDLNADQRRWKAEEEFLLGLMAKATSIDESLRIQNRLSDVRLQLEQIAGRLKSIQSRTDFSMVHVSLSEAPPEVVVEPAGEFAEVLDQAKTVIITVFSFLIIAAAAVTPIALLGLLAMGAWRLVRRTPTNSRRQGEEAPKVEVSS